MQASKSTVMMQHVQAAIEEMFSSPKLLAIQVLTDFLFIQDNLFKLFFYISGVQFTRAIVS